jgi:hypothetical protein
VILLFIIQILYLTICVGHHSVTMVWAPLYHAPSAPWMEFLSQPFDHLNGREWVEWKKKGLMRECWGNISQRQQNLGQGGEVKLGRISLFLCLDVKWDPDTSFYKKKWWLFGWVVGYSRWISWETSNSPWISTNSLQFFIFFNFCKHMRVVMVQQVYVREL